MESFAKLTLNTCLTAFPQNPCLPRVYYSLTAMLSTTGVELNLQVRKSSQGFSNGDYGFADYSGFVIP